MSLSVRFLAVLTLASGPGCGGCEPERPANVETVEEKCTAEPSRCRPFACAPTLDPDIAEGLSLAEIREVNVCIAAGALTDAEAARRTLGRLVPISEGTTEVNNRVFTVNSAAVPIEAYTTTIRSSSESLTDLTASVDLQYQQCAASAGVVRHAAAQRSSELLIRERLFPEFSAWQEMLAPVCDPDTGEVDPFWRGYGVITAVYRGTVTVTYETEESFSLEAGASCDLGAGEFSGSVSVGTSSGGMFSVAADGWVLFLIQSVERVCHDLVAARP